MSSKINASAWPTLLSAFSAGLRPDPKLSVSEWADERRFLASKTSAEPGRWRTSRTPYLKEIMDTLSPDCATQEVVFMKAAQIGGTEAGNNWLGFIIDHSPGPTMAVQPTLDMAKRLSTERIDPLIEACPSLREKVAEARSRDSGNSVLKKQFPGGILVLAGANSAVSLRSMPARNVFLDEVDGYPGNVDGEGDPVELAKARSRTFARRKIFTLSTPTIEGRSKISALFENSDKRRFFVPCPFCGERQWLKWSQMKWSAGDPKSAQYECEHCEELIPEHHKTEMLEAGEWVPEFPEREVAGFHLSSLYSPIGWYSWAEAARDYEKAEKDETLMRAFVNTVLGETWKEKGDAPDWKRLYERRETYAIGTVPARGLMLTAGVDVQKDRLEVQVVAWGRNREAWSVAYEVIPGDTASDVPWRALGEFLGHEFPHETAGVLMPIQVLAVDAGYNTQHVYNFARKWPSSRVLAVKGVPSLPVLVGQPRATEISTRGKTLRSGLKSWPVGVDHAKTELYGRLRLDAPVEGEVFPVGFVHFPEYEPEFFQQLTAEEIQTRVVRGFTTHQWVKTRDRNEALDTFIYARAAANVLGLERFTDAQWTEKEVALGIGVAPVDVIPSAPKKRWSFL